jgi:transposase-like protein
MEILNPKTPKMPKRVGRAPKYNLDWYMTMAKNVVEKGMSYREAAKVYGMSHGSVAHWKKVYLQGKFPKMKAAAAISPETKHLHLESQIRNLKQEIADLYLENLMLKKMSAYSRQAKKESSSIVTSENLDLYRERVE